MKRRLMMILTMTLVFGLVACERDETPSPRDETPSTIEETPETTPDVSPTPTLEPLETPRTDALTLAVDYRGMSYLEDGIGEAVLASCEDGDTAEFIVDGQQIRVRFLGIDTPEASHYYEPWGYQATQFVCSALASAETIVLERQEDRNLIDIYGRYLAFIWYDDRLINLEVIEKAYSHATGAASLKYAEEMMGAWFDIEGSNRRIHGETDPLFDYSTTGIDVSIETLVTDWAAWNFRVVNVEGVITALDGIHAHVQQDGYGIYLYVGHNAHGDLQVGHRIRLDNVRAVYDLKRRGGVHLTDFAHRRSELTVLETGLTVEPLSLDIPSIERRHHGRLLTFEHLTIIDIEGHLDGSLTMLLEDQSGHRITLIQSHHTFEYHRIALDDFQVGDHLVITGPLWDTADGWKILLTDPENIQRID